MKSPVQIQKKRLAHVSSSHESKINFKIKSRRRQLYPGFAIIAVFLIFFSILFFVSLKNNSKVNNPGKNASESFLNWFGYRNNYKNFYSADDFGIETIKSTIDFNNNGIDDYTDILLGARADAQNLPDYQDTYWADGYPPDDIGVCTDLIWRAFKNAGYCLKCMIDLDISQNISDYPRVEYIHDSNIDFRRVPNMKVFFDKYAISLTTDTDDISKWQPGDIVVFGDHHIGIISDKRNRYGIPYLIHNSGQPQREEDTLVQPDISGHYRFDASIVEDSLLIPFS